MIYEILKFKKKLFIFFYLLTLSNFSVSEIFIDGILDEEEWSSAKLIDDLVIVQPNTLEKSKYKTEVLYFANEKGIYFGFKNFKIQLKRQQKNLYINCGGFIYYRC